MAATRPAGTGCISEELRDDRGDPDAVGWQAVVEAETVGNIGQQPQAMVGVVDQCVRQRHQRGICHQRDHFPQA